MQPERPTFQDIRNFGEESYLLVKQLCDSKVKLAKARQQLTFNLRCKRSRVLPKSLRFKPPIRTAEVFAAASSYGFKCLELFIKNNHYRIREEANNINTTEQILSVQLPHELNCFAIEVSQNKFNRANTRIKEHLKEKFINLNQHIPTLTTNQKSWVKNLSSKTLSENQHEILSKGLNYNLGHRKFDKIKLLASIDPIIDQLENISAPEKSHLRSQIISAVKTAPKPPAIPANTVKAMRNLRNDASLVFANADKGNVTVVMDKSDYEEKVSNHLSNLEVYKKIPTNPVKKLQTNLNKAPKKTPK